MQWLKDAPKIAINAHTELTANGKNAAQNRWISYNKMRGQYASAMEHAVPEAFWVDKSRCSYTDESGQIKNPTEAVCAQGISAVKAIAIAQSQGQKIYTITQENAATALPKLPIGGSVGAEIRSAVQAGKEVTVHERAINAHGWSGYGYIVTDPETGAGGYIIEGKGNGGLLIIAGVAAAVAASFFANQVVAVLILAVSMLIIGCGLSMIFNDAKFFDIYSLIAGGIIAGLLEAASAGTITTFIIGATISANLIFGELSASCSNAKSS